MEKQTVVPPVWLSWFTCLGGLAAYFWATGDGLTAAVVCLVAVTGLIGHSLGGAVILAFLTTLATSALFATKLSEVFGPSVGDVFGTTGILNRILAACIGCILVGFVGMLFFEIVWNRLLGKRGHLRAFNQSLGLSLGAIQGVVLSLVILGGVTVAEPYAWDATRTEAKTVRGYVGQCTADGVIHLGEASRRSPLGPFIKRFNPFDRIPQLRQLRRHQDQWVVDCSDERLEAEGGDRGRRLTDGARTGTA